MYKEYLQIKKQYPDALVFYRIGDFYELFGQDAETASKVLDLVLTSRDCGLSERVPMCGVPYHALDNYIAKLVQEGYKTAICESVPKVNEPMKLNLDTKGAEQVVLKEYLEANASDVLIEKINNGVKIVKDGKTLVSKKTLDTFIDYGCEEARKIAEKGARSACVQDNIVFNWLMHYFEEDSIEGKLFNEDGTEYKPIKAVSKTSTVKPAAPVIEKPKPQMSLFDIFDNQAVTEEVKTEANEETEELGETDIEEPDSDCDDDEEAEEIETQEIPVSPTKLFRVSPTEPLQASPTKLFQVSPTQWVDSDGVIYDSPERKEQAAPDILIKILGNAVMR